MRLSEQIGDGLYFLRIATEHHNVGLRPGESGEPTTSGSSSMAGTPTSRSSTGSHRWT